MFTCPGCGMLMQILTKEHLKQHHNGMSKAEFKKQYGDKLNYVQPPSSKEFAMWMKSFPQLTNADYDIAQSSARSMIKR